jgi:ribosomal protein L11 methyltransferase
VSWYAVELQPEPERREAVAAWLVGRTGQAIEERADGTLVSFALDLATAQALEQDLARVHGVRAFCRELPVVDWSTAWRAGLGVRRVGRFAIVPTWSDYEPSADEEPIRIDPGMAFGSGEHGSTRGALALMERWVRPGDAVVDLGAGSGILTVAAAHLGAARAIGVEVDAEALPVAARNAEQNGVADGVSFIEGDAAVIMPLLGPVDVVISNILRLVNVAILPEIHGALRPGGTAIFAGMEEAEAAAFRAPLVAGGFRVREELVDEGWWAVAAERI